MSARTARRELAVRRLRTSVSAHRARGYELAGFVAGEGSFLIRSTEGAAWRCVLSVECREDELPYLEALRTWTGVGRIHARPARSGYPTMVWVVDTKAGCQALVRIFDRCPVPGKKSADYAIWREAVREWTRPPARRRWDRIACLARDLHAVRLYRPLPT